ncbi:hypothetical protein CONPUDRAFT_66193, partial [Coniophora puteana RWD-64-598 SS2]
NVAPAIVRQGFIPSAPVDPDVAFSIDTLELYRVIKGRNPRESTQAYVRSLCDLHEVPFEIHLTRQFSIAFDIYLQIRAKVDQLVHVALRRDSPNWRLKHVCPACMYKLKDEPSLKFALLYTIDGNDSLKRVFKRSNNINADGPTESSELPTLLKVRTDRYIDRATVNKWANAQLDRALTAEDIAANPCAARWKNMKEDITKKMWSVFDETGIFLAVCRHGFSLLVVDMVKSGELSKYPLAIIERMLHVFGKNLGTGYDIGCKFNTTIANTRLGALAVQLEHACLVGAFHGHSHRRLCQIDHLSTYVEGLGTEDLEGCERKFSQTNDLAIPTRHASIFHRQQHIDLYLEYLDEFEVYPNLVTFLYNNYRQALQIISDGVPSLRIAMAHLKITDTAVFKTWLEEERVYLKSLESEPVEETTQMEYWKALVRMQDNGYVSFLVNPTWINTTSNASSASAARIAGSKVRHAQENYDRSCQLVQDIERRLEINTRWTSADDEWQKAGRLVAKRTYQRTLDKLEGLLVARILEMDRYSVRQHVAKALQSRAAAIRAALDLYNKAARALRPPARALTWEEVSKTSFLKDLDLLRDTRQDVSKRPWAKPAARAAMDDYFKLCRAYEEIERLNVEIKRVATYLRDEDRYLSACEKLLQEQHPALALQVGIHHRIRGRCNDIHRKKLRAMAALEGFNGSIDPGESVDIGPGESASIPAPIVPPALLSGAAAVNVEVHDSDLKDNGDDSDDNEDIGRADDDALQAELYDDEPGDIQPIEDDLDLDTLIVAGLNDVA